MNNEATQYHKDTVLWYLLHTLSQPTRLELMREHPAAYNDVVGQSVVRVVRAEQRVPLSEEL